MLISTRGRYALRIMLELAQYDQSPYMPLPLIAEKQGISEKYLESIVSLLVKGGLVEGVRGKGGGYRLRRPLQDYSAGSNATTMLCMDAEKTFYRKYAFGADGDKLAEQLAWLRAQQDRLPLCDISEKNLAVLRASLERMDLLK